MMLFAYIVVLLLLHSVIYVWAEACTNIIQPELQRNALKEVIQRDQNHDPLSQSLGSAWIEVRDLVG